LYFEDPLYLSYEKNDELKVEFRDTLMFVSEAGLALDVTNQVQTKAIPR
jgi:hypothetical protein